MNRPFARRGAAYLIFLATALMVTVLGLTALAARRIDARRTEADGDATKARLLARSAVELGLAWIDADPQWRRNASAAAWNTDLAVSGGTLRAQAVDPTDGQLDDSAHDPVLLRGTGIYGAAKQVVQVTLDPEIEAVDVLQASLQTQAAVTVAGGSSIFLNGGPLWVTGTLQNSGIINGNVEAQSVSGLGLILGVVTKTTAHHDVKIDEVWPIYAARATTVPFSSDWSKIVLAPGLNPWGAANSDGVYHVTSSNKDMRIRDSRVCGTLLVDVGSKTLQLDGKTFLHPGRTDYPVLIVKGNLELRLKSATETLSESGQNTNYNPSGAPYLGATDNDKLDTYPNGIEGLVFVTGTIVFKEVTRVDGVVLADGNVAFDDGARLNHDDNLVTNPPEGFSVVSLHPQLGSWTRLVD